MTKKNIITFICMVLVLVPQFASAAAASVRPFLIDEIVEPRDIVTRQITLTNETGRRTLYYATVNGITLDNDGEIMDFVTPVMTDRTNTATSWVEISRGRIDLEAGESTEIPVTLRIHPFAESGVYHVFVGFPAAQNRPIAEAAAMNGDADGVILKITVADTTSESLHISNFSLKRFVLNEDDREIQIEVENIGDAPSSPTGEIIFYSPTGEEVAAVTINEEAKTIPPGEKVTFASSIPFSDKLGRFKANLTLHYGEEGKSTVFDTAQFYMIPYRIMLLLLLGILCFSIFVTVLLKKAFDEEYDGEDDEHGKSIPLFIQTGREYKDVDHDITLTKNK